MKCICWTSDLVDTKVHVFISIKASARNIDLREKIT